MPRLAKPKPKLPYPFVLEALMPLTPEVRRMFSGFAVYVGDRIVFMLRDHQKSPRDNGVWLVLSESADPGDPELRREFPSIPGLSCWATRSDTGSSSRVTARASRWRRFMRAICCYSTTLAWDESQNQDGSFGRTGG